MTAVNVGVVVWPPPTGAPGLIEPSTRYATPRAALPAPSAPRRSSSPDHVVGNVTHLPAARVLHSVALPASKARFDHLVIGPCGIYAIDVLHGIGTIERRKDTLWLGGSDLRGECISAWERAGEVGTYLQHAVIPVLCFADAKLPAPVMRLRHVVICTPGVLAQHINGGPRCLDASAVQFFADRALALRAAVVASMATMALPDPRPHVRRPTSPAAAPARHSKSFVRRTLATAAGTMVCIGGAWAVPVLAHLTDPGFDQFVRASSASKSDALVSDGSSDTLAPAPPTGVLQGGATPPTESAGVSPFPAPELLPTLGFTCPQPGAGWTASAVATQLLADPVGYHLWYQTAGANWQYWGQFKSEIQAPARLPGLQPGEALDVRMDRSFHPNAEGAPTMLTFTAPDAPC